MSLESIVQQIDAEIANLTNARNALAGLNGSSTSSAPIQHASTGVTNGTGKRKFSASAIAKMRAAQRARWQKYRAAKGQTAAKSQTAAKPVRVMSASARKRIAAAQKARWAKVRAAKKAA
jgi:hypothetical protein